MSSPSLLYRLSQVASSTTIILWLATRACYAQSQDVSFGEVRSFLLPGKYQKAALLSDRSAGITPLLVWSAERREITSVQFDSSFSSIQCRRMFAPIAFDDVFVADLNADGISDLILYTRARKSFSIILHYPGDSLQVESTVDLPFEPSTVFIGDYNNDRKMDILITNRSNLGIVPLVGNGKGFFTEGRLIAGDNAVGGIALAHLNNDNLVDMIVYDWVKSELHALYGVGRGRFLDQSVFPVQGEIDRIVTVPPTQGRPLNLFLVGRQQAQAQIWEADDFGDFRQVRTIALTSVPTDYAIADINGDGLDDIVLINSAGTMQVIFQAEEESQLEHTDFAAGLDPRSVVLSNLYKDRKKDAIILDGEGQRLSIFFNGARPSHLRDSIEYVVGIQPSNLVLKDFNGDRIVDAAVVNSESGSMSLLWGRKQMGLQGQISYALSPVPRYLSFHSVTDSSVRFIVSYPQKNLLSFFDLHTKENSALNAVVPSEGPAEVLRAHGEKKETAEFVCLNSTNSSEGASLSFYEQLGLTTFLERTFRLSHPSTLLGATVVDLNGDHLVDIVYVYRPDDTSSVELGVAFGDSTFSMKRRIFSQEFTLGNVQKSYLWTADFDHDDTLDLLIAFPTSIKQLLVARGRGEGLFYEPKLVASIFAIEDRSQLQIVDADGDEVLDIVANSSEAGGVGWWKGRGDMTFEPWRLLVANTDITHTALGDINGDGILDVGVTLGKKGTLKIYDGRMFFSSRGAVGKP